MITTKDGQTLPLGKFTVFVGANNVGKSQSLKDIRNGAGHSPFDIKILVTSVDLDRYKKVEDLLSGVYLIPWQGHSSEDPKENFALGLSFDLRTKLKVPCSPTKLTELISTGTDIYKIGDGSLRNFSIAYLDAESRLRVASECSSHAALEEPPEMLLQALFTDRTGAERELREIFRATFNQDIKFDYSSMTRYCFRVAPSFDDVPDDPREAHALMSTRRKLDDQGDGIRSFVGVVLSMLLCRQRILLLDEPEGFLHPSQARRLGSWIAKYSQKHRNQIIIATHSAHFLGGLLSEPSGLEIFRFDRNGDKMHIEPVPKEAVANLAKSPLLSSQRVLESFFHSGVVVCEADADRSIYQTVAERTHDNHNVLFLHAQNKQTLAPVVSILRAAKIPVCAIADIDLLNSKDDLEKLLAAFQPGQQFEDILKQRAILATGVDNRSEDEILKSLKNEVLLFVEQMDKNEHVLSGARGALRRIEAGATKWSQIKDKGVAGFAESDQTTCNQLLSKLRELGVFLVSKGELENWIDLGTRKKNKWAPLALQYLWENECPEELHNFVRDILHSLGETPKPFNQQPVPEQASSLRSN
jgi:hypothetical protein